MIIQSNKQTNHQREEKHGSSNNTKPGLRMARGSHRYRRQREHRSESEKEIEPWVDHGRKATLKAEDYMQQHDINSLAYAQGTTFWRQAGAIATHPSSQMDTTDVALTISDFQWQTTGQANITLGRRPKQLSRPEKQRERPNRKVHDLTNHITWLAAQPEKLWKGTSRKQQRTRDDDDVTKIPEPHLPTPALPDLAPSLATCRDDWQTWEWLGVKGFQKFRKFMERSAHT